MPRLIVVSGPPDWLMSALRSIPEVWQAVELPLDRRGQVGAALLARVAGQQLRRGASCILDVVARETLVSASRALAADHRASFHLIECVCPDEAAHRTRIEGRVRAIRGWYELSWEGASASRRSYVPLLGPKLVLDTMDDAAANLEQALTYVEGG